MTAAVDDLLAAVLRHPHEAAPRAMLRDELEDAGAWDWPTVLGYVLAHPDADGPRLLAADWLEGDGQGEWAAYIRVAVELARTPECTPGSAVAGVRCRRCELDARQGDLWRALDYGAGWLPAAWRPAPACEVRRGFIEVITCPAAAWLEHADAVTAAHPVRAVALTTWPDLKVFDRDEAGGRLLLQLPGGGHRAWSEPHEPWAAVTGRLLALEWPGVSFTTPTAGGDHAVYHSPAA